MSSTPKHIAMLALFSASLTHCLATGCLCLSPRRNGTLCRNHMSQAHSCPPWAAQHLKQIPALSSSAASARGFPTHLSGQWEQGKKADFVTTPKLNKHACLNHVSYCHDQGQNMSLGKAFLVFLGPTSGKKNILLQKKNHKTPHSANKQVYIFPCLNFLTT